jgi:hypothetical protein
VKTLLAEYHARAKQLARDNADDATLDKAKNKNRAAQIRIHTLSATLMETDQQILQLENDFTVAADKKQREAAALEVEKIAEGFTNTAADVVTSLAALALQTESMARFLPDAAGLHSFAVRAKAELPCSIETLTMLIRANTDAVLAGHANPAFAASRSCCATASATTADAMGVFGQVHQVDGCQRDCSNPTRIF